MYPCLFHHDSRQLEYDQYLIAWQIDTFHDKHYLMVGIIFQWLECKWRNQTFLITSLKNG